MAESILITGATGFIGSHFSKKLKASNASFNCFEGDISSFETVQRQVKEFNPTTIFHFAGLSNVADCESNPDKAFSINVQGTFNLLESIKRKNKKTHLIFLSTSHVYKSSEPTSYEIRIDEEFPLDPQTVYARSKLFCEDIIRHYYQRYDIGHATVFRLFNHTHSSQKGPFFFPQLYNQLIEQKTSAKPKEIIVGNLNIQRDFSLVSDLLRLLEASLDEKAHEKFNVYNVCSGQPRKLIDLANLLSRELGLKVSFKIDSSKIRKNEPLIVVGSNTKISNNFNWAPSKLSDTEFITSFLTPINESL